jgi:hypothetical protein
MVNNMVDLKKNLEKALGLKDLENFLESYKEKKISHNSLKLILKEFFEK